MSRRLPSRSEIERRAKERHMIRSTMHGLPAITPERHEVSETGGLVRARNELMRSEETRYSGEQRRYLDTMAKEMGLKVLTKREFKQAEKGMGKVGYKWINGWGEREKAKPKPRARKKPKKPLLPVVRAPKISVPIIVAPKKKRRKRHVERAGKNMRKLRKRIKDGQKVFSFPDHIWKVRK